MTMGSPPLLLLWDIDGTLSVSGGAGMRALSAALQTTFGISHPLADIEYAGRTDRWILRQIFDKFNLPTDDLTVSRFFATYFRLLPTELSPATSYTLPGVTDLVRSVHGRSDIAQGLLTGNMRESAEIKMRFSGLWDYFPFGAYGNEHERRNDLGPLAMERARAHHGLTFVPERTWIIGDTPHDIECGRAMGARTLAVATGSHSLEDLRKHAPDGALGNLANADAFWSIVLTPRS